MKNSNYQLLKEQAIAIKEWEKERRVRKQLLDDSIKKARDALDKDCKLFVEDTQNVAEFDNMKRRMQKLKSPFAKVGAERTIVDAMRLIMRQPLCTQTHVLYDPEVDEDVAPWLKLSGSKIVCGKFGIGIRENINSRQCYDYNDIQYVVAHGKIVSQRFKELSAKGRIDFGSTADALLKACEFLWDIAYLSGDRITVPCPQLEVVDTWNTLRTIVGVTFINGSEVPRVVFKSGTTEVLSPHASFGLYIEMREHIDSILTKMEQISASSERFQDTFTKKESQDFKDELNGIVSRWKLMGIL